MTFFYIYIIIGLLFSIGYFVVFDNDKITVGDLLDAFISVIIWPYILYHIVWHFFSHIIIWTRKK